MDYDPEAHFRYILGSERGSLSYSTGIVRVQSLETTDWTGEPDSNDLTLLHEMVHQLHALTTPFLFAYCEDYRHLLSEFIRWLQSGRPDEFIGRLRRELAVLEQAIEDESGADPIDGLGFSARHLIEGAASVEPLRPLASSEGAVACLERLRSWVNEDPVYLRAIDALCRLLGPEHGLRLFSTLVFAALHYGRPGEAFATMLRQLNEDPIRSRQMKPADVLESFLPFDSLILRFANGHKMSRTPQWNTAGMMFARSGPIAAAHLVAANPSSMLFGSNYGSALGEDAGRALTPPLTIAEDGRIRIAGVLLGLPENEQREVVHILTIADELTGVMVRLGQPHRQIRNACTHLTCPEHKGHLCSLAYPPPNNGHWSDCEFRKRFLEYVGMSLGDFADRYGLV
ncbi:hypothetical protein [Amycolatopsis sp. Hca4]|uniref:hypothetical protein n=1 Tax=Amycolatopsis sp. Hca4 TaxID=2742131 RepID=UPI0015927DD3|nr:hypothetical protein [Amycolatopsis sp. Hca4]QKV74091.1 hypothetical protein HUT10_10155 [Amycolatopsis sp. Hca4]